MGLYLLNICVDTADPNPKHIPEDLSFNDQESIVEIIIEKVLGFEDAFAEYDDPDSEEHNKKKNVKIDLLVYSPQGNEGLKHSLNLKKKLYLDHGSRLTMGFYDIDSPPPKV
ncbi:hypothetical protein [Flagellimonas sp.]|uniref:hypothetical protein n=1 Tax=Flagellimonas sp. TaxID=2058762 RepID=UPI003BAA467D